MLTNETWMLAKIYLLNTHIKQNSLKVKANQKKAKQKYIKTLHCLQHHLVILMEIINFLSHSAETSIRIRTICLNYLFKKSINDQ